MIDTMLRHTEGTTAAGCTRVRVSTPAAYAATGFGTRVFSTTAAAANAAAWRIAEQKKSMNPVDLHHPRPPDLAT